MTNNFTTQSHNNLCLSASDIMKPIKIPKAVQESFLQVARYNKDKDGRMIETLAFLMGYETEEDLIATSIVFPSQSGDAGRVTDEGMNLSPLFQVE